MILGILTGFFASLFGWQVNLVAIEKGINRHRLAALLVGLGAAFADLSYIYIYFTGAQLIAEYPFWWQVLKWVGAVTILGLAAGLLFKKPKPLAVPGEKKRGAKRYFLLGFLLVITNPAIFLMWVGLLSFILTHFSAPTDFPFQFHFMGGFMIGAASWFVLLSFQTERIMKRLTDARHRVWLYRATAILLLGAAVFLIFENF